MTSNKEMPWNVPITRDLRPAYYDDFHCLAAGCRYSCCKGWQITFDKKEYLSLKRQEGSPELAGRLAEGVRRIRREHPHYGEFDMHTGVCPLLGEDELCILQKERGHEALPEVCRSFPRIEQYMPSGYLERSLSPACEAVLALLWDLPDGIEFRSDPLPREKVKELRGSGGTLLLEFPVIRDVCIDLLQDRRLELPQRIFLMGAALRELAEGETDLVQWEKRARALPAAPGAAELLDGAEKSLPLFLSSNLQVLSRIYTESAAMHQIRMEILAAMHPFSEADGTSTISLTPYREAAARFESVFGERAYFMENLMTALFFHLHMPKVNSREMLWKSYVLFCDLYAFYRFLAVMSCREGAPGDREELFRMVIFASRTLVHSGSRQLSLQEELFQHDSATLGHMAVLLGG